jgi:predicted Zn-dependent protease with MMP-like domain
MRTRVNTVAERARRARFQRLVEQAMRGQLDNVEIVVENEPTPAQRQAGDKDSDELFGLYEGIPQSERGSSYSMVVPDRIVIFQGPLERAFPDRRELEEEIRITVLHEVAHHFGFDEDAIDELGLG